MAPSSLLVASTATALLLLFLSACSCRAAGNSPSAVVLPVRKDGATGQYLTGFRQRTPQVPVTAVLDLGGGTLWVDCDAGYVSSSYARVPCASKLCRLAKTGACATSCVGKPSPGCLNDTCGGFPENTVTRISTGGNLITDVLSVPTTFRPAPGPLATAPAFLFTCGATFLTEGLAAGATGMASLSRARFALPTQLAATFRFSRKFALCLTSTSAAGVVVFGDAPYAFQPGVDLSKSLLYTPLLVNNVSTAGVSGEKDKSSEYFIGVTAIKVNGRAVPLNASLLAIDKQGGGGTKLSTVAPYTVLETSIHKAVTDAAGAAERGRVVGGVRGQLDGGRQGWRAVPRRGGRRRGPADVGGGRGPHDGGQPAGVRSAAVAARVQLLPAVPADDLQQFPPWVGTNGIRMGLQKMIWVLALFTLQSKFVCVFPLRFCFGCFE
ncbi:hypothetical protein VPH35_009237 [Triticum aestivum]